MSNRTGQQIENEVVAEANHVEVGKKRERAAAGRGLCSQPLTRLTPMLLRVSQSLLARPGDRRLRQSDPFGCGSRARGKQDERASVAITCTKERLSMLRETDGSRVSGGPCVPRRREVPATFDFVSQNHHALSPNSQTRHSVLRCPDSASGGREVRAQPRMPAPATATRAPAAAALDSPRAPVSRAAS